MLARPPPPPRPGDARIAQYLRTPVQDLPRRQFDGLFEQPSVADWGFVAALVWLAYRAGQSSATRKKTPSPTLGAVLSGYVGLRAMDKLFGVTK